MPVTLTATPLTSTSSVRLHLSASVPEYPTFLTETLTGLSASAVNATASRWTTYGTWNWTVASDTGGNSLRFSPGTYTGTGTPPARSYGVRRTITGLTVGQRYVAYLGLIANMGEGDVIEITLGGATVLFRNPITQYAVGSSSGQMPNTPYVLDFTATASSMVLQFTNQGANQSVHFSYTWLRIVPVLTGTTVVQNDFAANDTGVTTGGTPPSGGAQSRSFESVGTNIVGTYTSPSGTTSWPAGGVYLSKTLSGLTVGQRYRLLVALQAQKIDPDGGAGGGPLTMAFPFRINVVGKVVSGGDGTGPYTWKAVEFVATATSHVLRLSFDQTLTIASDEQASLRWGYYRLDTVPSADDAYTLTGITRSDNNGVRPVRTYEGSDLSNGEFIVTDYEPAMSWLIQYRATVYNAVTEQTETATATAQFPDGFSYGYASLAPVALPQQALAAFVIGYTGSRQSSTTLANVIGRDDPLPTLGAQSLRTGQFEVLVSTYAEGVRLQSIYDARAVVMLRQPDPAGLDMYHVGTSTDLAIEPEVFAHGRYWRLTVEYAEVAPPSTYLQGSLGWTIAASLSRNPTLAASRAEFPTVLDLMIGPDA